MKFASIKWVWLPFAVVATSLALAVAVIALFGLPIRTALASSIGASDSPGGGPWSWNSGWHGGPWGNGSGFTLPPELQGLTDLPPDQRFSHFAGARINLKDKNGNPLAIVVTPGTVTAATSTSLSLKANDGTSKTFALDAKTIVHGGNQASGGQTTQPALKKGDAVVAVSLNQSTTATAVIDGGPNGFNWSGPAGRWHATGPGH